MFKPLMTLSTFALVGLSLSACGGQDGEGPLPQEAATSLPLAETIAEFPPGTFLENLVIDDAGSLLVTSYLDGRILHVTPSGDVSTLAEIPGYPVGIALDVDGTAYVTVHRESAFGPPNPNQAMQVYMLDAQAPTGAEWVADLPQASFLNGIERLSAGVFLIADSQTGQIFRFDAPSGEVSVWLDDPLLYGQEGVPVPAANGIKVFGGKVYISNSIAGRLVEVSVVDGQADAAAAFADINLDDFAFSEAGILYGATHTETVVRFHPDLGVEAIAGADEAVSGNTAVALGKTDADRNALYVISDGGFFQSGGDPSLLGPATIVRLRLDAPPALQ